ncbi:MAG: hypothetical protein Q9170_000971 [Blastenia crenularia]
MPKDLAKVQKKISKKKGSKASIHENSRDAKRLRRAGARSDKLERLATARGKASQPMRTQRYDPWTFQFMLELTDHLAVQRIAFFRTAAESMTQPFTVSSTQSLIETYLSRSSSELSTLQSARRPGRPTSTREDMLRQRTETEAKEYVSGYWIPDMEDLDTLEKLRAWNEEWTSLNTLKFVRITQQGVRHASSFPPKGKS